MNRILLLFIVSAILTACGTGKEVSEKKDDFSSKDYPYIEKFHEGVRYKIQGRLPEAQAKFEECLLIRTDDDAVYYALSQIHLMQDDFNKSAEYIQNAADIDPNNLWYTQELAYMFFEMKDFQKSVDNFKKLVDKEPRNIEWLYGYAEALVQNNEVSKAIDALNSTEDQVGSYPELAVQKYSLYMSIGQEEEALAEIEACKKKYPKSPQLIATLVDHYFRKNDVEKAVSMLIELVEADPTNGRAHMALADIYRQQHEFDKSYEELLLAIPSNDVDLDSKMRILIAIHDMVFAKDEKAIELVNLLVETHPEEAKAYSIRADFHLKQDNEVEALADYKLALEFDDSQYAIWNQVLIMEYQARQFEELYADSKKCIDLFPTMATVYLLNGVSANQLEKHSEAIDVLLSGKEMIINDQVLLSEFYGQLGEANFALGNLTDGNSNYKKAIELDSRSNLLKNNYAYRLASAKQNFELAKSLIKQCMESSPRNGQYVDTYGWIFFKEQNYEDALEQFEKANLLSPGDKLTIEHIGDANAMLGNISEALKSWKSALELVDSDAYLSEKIKNKKYHEREK